MVGVLRDAGPAGAGPTGWRWRPTPSTGASPLAELPDLLARFDDAGLHVRSTVTGAPPALPPGAGADRLPGVQEALTNALKHAGVGAGVEVALSYTAEAVVVRVRRRRSRPPAGQPGAAGGHGLLGMRERVTCTTARSPPARDRAVAGRGPAAATVGPGNGGDRGMTVRVVIVDDQALVRAGFRMVLDSQPDLEVVGEAVDGARGPRVLARTEADVVADGHPDAGHGRGGGDPPALRRTPAARPRVLVLTTFDTDDVRVRGAAGRGQRVPAQERPAGGAAGRDPGGRRGRRGGGPVDHPPPAGPVRRPLGAAPAPTRARPAHRPGTGGAAAGRPGPVQRGDRRPAARAEATVKTHVGRILAKLELRDRVQAVVLAYESGLVTPGRMTPRTTWVVAVGGRPRPGRTQVERAGGDRRTGAGHSVGGVRSATCTGSPA